MFADGYLQKHRLFPPFIFEPPESDLKRIIVIPCYDEPDVIMTLECLWKCRRASGFTEVIVVINSSEKAEQEKKERNSQTLIDISGWIADHHDPCLRFYTGYFPDLPAKFAGVGLSRKIGMDEAVHRFNLINLYDGLIISLDADTLCDENYLTALDAHLQSFPQMNACSVYFEHPISGEKYSPDIYKGIVQYELYLRYYVRALRMTGFPYAFQTIGSCFTVKAGVYARQGGMNRRQAGEDFYFLHKIIPLGHFHELTGTCIIPSPRISCRVPFGTGAWQKNRSEHNLPSYPAYNLSAFLDLKIFFLISDRLFMKDTGQVASLCSQLPETIKNYLTTIHFLQTLSEINSNCANQRTFKKRFFHEFNAFRILKYMNHVHKEFYAKMPVVQAAGELLALNGEKNIPDDPVQLLALFRNSDRTTPPLLLIL